MSRDKYAQLYAALSRKLAQSGRAVLAIDGRSGAGKTTLAQTVRSEFGGCCIHTDDFFLPPELRSEQRRAEPGGNVDYARFAAEVTPGILAGGEFTYRAYDCHSGEYTEKRVNGDGLLIVEGSYSMHPKLGVKYDVTVFCDTSIGVQISTLTAREGAEGVKPFIEKWIPLEEAYFRHFCITEACDFIIPR